MATIMRVGGGASGASAAPELLWTNASPTSSFAEQTIYFSGNYAAYLIEARHTTSTVGRLNITCGNANASFTIASISSATLSSASSYYRQATTTSNSITINTVSNNTTRTIPTRIWGLKGAV